MFFLRAAFLIESIGGCRFLIYEVNLSEAGDTRRIKFQSPSAVGPGYSGPVVFELTATDPGDVTLIPGAYGEQNCGSRWMWLSMAGDPLIFTVSE